MFSWCCVTKNIELLVLLFYLSYWAIPFLWILSPIDVTLYFNALVIFDCISRAWAWCIRWIIELTMSTAITRLSQSPSLLTSGFGSCPSSRSLTRFCRRRKHKSSTARASRWWKEIWARLVGKSTRSQANNEEKSYTYNIFISRQVRGNRLLMKSVESFINAR